MTPNSFASTSWFGQWFICFPPPTTQPAATLLIFTWLRNPFVLGDPPASLYPSLPYLYSDDRSRRHDTIAECPRQPFHHELPLKTLRPRSSANINIRRSRIFWSDAKQYFFVFDEERCGVLYVSTCAISVLVRRCYRMSNEAQHPLGGWHLES